MPGFNHHFLASPGSKQPAKKIVSTLEFIVGITNDITTAYHQVSLTVGSDSLSLSGYTHNSLGMNMHDAVFLGFRFEEQFSDFGRRWIGFTIFRVVIGAVETDLDQGGGRHFLVHPAIVMRQ